MKWIFPVLSFLLLFSCNTTGNVPEVDGTSWEDKPQISPESPKIEISPEPEILSAPWDWELGSLVNEKPTVSPVPRLPPGVGKNSLIPLDKPKPPSAPITLIPTEVAPPVTTTKQNPPILEKPIPIETRLPPVPRVTTPPTVLLPRVKDPDLTLGSDLEPLPQIEYEDITARMGDDVFFQFTPQGWIFNDKDQVGKTAGYFSTDLKDPLRSVFLFKPKIPGTYELEFRRSDLITGITRVRKIKLQVLDPNSVVLNSQVESADLAAVLKMGEELERSGKDNQARDLYLNHYDPASSILNWRLAGLFKKLRDIPEAQKYWNRNLLSENSYWDPSWQELLKSYLDTSATEDFLLNLSKGKDLGKIVPEDILLRGIDYLGSKGRLSEAFDWMSEYEKDYMNSKKIDALFYIKANLLERQTPFRNIKEAVRLYKTIQQDFPLSSYWTLAKERSEELERQFFRIR